MQILGGIGYTQVYPVERMLRDIGLGIIWTGSNEIMKLLIQHEAYIGLCSSHQEIETSRWMRWNGTRR